MKKNVNTTVKTASAITLSAIKADYRNFIWFQEHGNGDYIPVWNYWSPASHLGEGLVPIVVKELDRHFFQTWKKAFSTWETCAPAQVRDFIWDIEKYGANWHWNISEGHITLNFHGADFSTLPDKVLRDIIIAARAIISLRDARDAFEGWEDYSHFPDRRCPALPSHMYDWEYEASDEMLAIVRSRCEEILALREKERKRKEREARAARPLTNRPFAAALAHLAA